MPKNVNNTTFPSLLDLIAPHSCRGCGSIGTALCSRCKNYIISSHVALCPNCKTPTPNAKCPNCANLPLTYIVGERQNLIGSLVHDYKYNSIRALAKPLAEMLDAILPPLEGHTLIVPLPTIGKHIRLRGLDHTLLIAKHLSRIRNYKYQQILTRARDTVQVGSNHRTRTTQAHNAYAIDNHFHPDPKTTYLLLDDVWTTGASMLSANKKLQDAGVNHTVIAILALSRIS